MQRTASPARRHLLPKSLMERLALLAQGELLPATRQHSRHQPRRGAVRGSLPWFGLGALAGGAVGGVLFLGLHALAVGKTGTPADKTIASAAVGEIPEHAAQPKTFEVAIDRRERAGAPLGLRLTGAEHPDIEVILQGIPPTARLSRGEHRDAQTWVLKRADLDGLTLALEEAAPDAFDVRIDVLAPPGMATQPSIVRVRLVDNGSPLQTKIVTGADRKAEATTGGADIAKQAPARTSGDDGDDKVARRRAPVADASVAAPAPQPWPEGASGLGAIPRESERQVWWSMPPPAWSPFQDRAEQP